MTDSSSQQRSPDESPSQGVAHNVDRAQRVARIEASDDGGADDGYESYSSSAAYTS